MSATTAVPCPACGLKSTTPLRCFTAREAANHLIPTRRDPVRNLALQQALHDLWGSGGVRIDECASCGFGFAVPFQAGTPEIYNLFGGGAQHYPTDRFEFSATTSALQARGGIERLLEVGAGSGAFLRQLLGSGVVQDVTATEYDDSAIAKLESLGDVRVFQGDFRGMPEDYGPFDAICLFQVMEHLDRLDDAFATFRRLLRSGGEVYIGVPNASRTRVQEEHTGFMDMPPVHIGRWTSAAMAAMSERHGFAVLDEQVNPQKPAQELYKLAVYGMEQRSRDENSWTSRLEAIQMRPLRGGLKRAAALQDVIRLRNLYKVVPANTRWFRVGLVV